MLKKALFFVVFVLITPLSHSAQPSGKITNNIKKESSTSEGIGSVYLVKGAVYVAHGEKPAHQVTRNETIVANTLISTDDKSAALLKFSDGQVVTMQANSILRIREYRYNGKNNQRDTVVFSMFKGGMRFITGLIGQKTKQAFRLKTPFFTIGIRGTDFMVVMLNDSMYSQILTGSVAITNSAGMKIVNAGQTAVVTSSKSLVSMVSASAAPSAEFGEIRSIPIQPSSISVPPTAAPVYEEVQKLPAQKETSIAPIAQEKVVTETLSDSVEEEAYLDQKEKTTSKSKSGFIWPRYALSGKVGTLGYGGELVFGRDTLNGRIGFNKYFFHKNGKANSMNFDFKFQLLSVTAIMDWYPFDGDFRISGGVINNKAKFKLKAIPDAGANYTIGANTYSASTAVSDLRGRVTFSRPLAPYVGIGWGNPVLAGKGWGIVSDFGVMFHGAPKYSLTATCATGFTGCAALQNDVAAEQAKQQKDLNKKFKYWPVLSIGLTYQW